MRLQLDQNRMANAMHASASEVFTMMLNSTIKHDNPQRGTYVDSEEYGVVSLMGLTGEWTGNAGLCCSADCARWIASQMLFSEYPEVNDEVRDAVGEITNMIIGNFKNNISDQTGNLAMSTPTVIFGRELRATIKGVEQWIVFPFASPEHSFCLMVQLQSTFARKPFGGTTGTRRGVQDGNPALSTH
jgi:chemotaxis protein CheX